MPLYSSAWKMPIRLALAAAVLIALAAQGGRGAEADTQAADAAPSAEQIASLENALSGAVLVGNFTVTGQTDAGAQKLIAERYELAAVKHFRGDRWVFQARIAYGDHDVTLPLTLPVKWAGDTPVISVDTMPFPGLGTYSARVMIYQDHYAGIWSGADHGGHLFGMVERGQAKAEQQEQ